MGCPPTLRQCLLTSIAPIHDELLWNVQRLWQLDTVPQWEGKEVTRSKQDQEALQLLDRKTLILEMEGIHRLTTPLLRRKDMPLLSAPKESVLPTLRSVGRHLLKDPVKAEVCEEEMKELIETGAVRELTDLIPDSPECWYIPITSLVTMESSILSLTSISTKDKASISTCCQDPPSEPHCWVSLSVSENILWL